MMRRSQRQVGSSASSSDDDGVCASKSHRQIEGDGSKRKRTFCAGGKARSVLACFTSLTLSALLFGYVNKYHERFHEQVKFLRKEAGKALAVDEDTVDVVPVASSQLFISDLEKSSKLVSTQIDQLSADKAEGAGSKRPVLVTGWNVPDVSTEEQFLKDYGDFPIYIKDSLVQIRSADCVLSYRILWDKINDSKDILAFTNNKENANLFDHLKFETPDYVQHINSFSILSTMQTGQSHSFHKHGETWFGLATGVKIWWFLPPTAKQPERVNACDYLSGKATAPAGVQTAVQTPGTIIWFPKDWYHATCALDPWTAGVGQQQGPLIRQTFKPLPATSEHIVSEEQATKLWSNCTDNQEEQGDDWKWYGGDLKQYYNDLEKDHKRNPNDAAAYAVHRWMGDKRSTLVHYELIHDAIHRHLGDGHTNNIAVLDAGCGLGSALTWMEQHEPTWKLHGRTLSDEQVKFIETKLPEHKFDVALASFNDLSETYNVIYSIEAMIHSTDIEETIEAWAEHLTDDGAIVVIDDFLSPGVDRSDHDVDQFCKSWLANSPLTLVQLHGVARKFGLKLVEARDLTAEYRIVELNYRNKLPNLNPDRNKNHQGWMGAKYRHKLTVEGKLGYHMVVFQKAKQTKGGQDCAAVPSSSAEQENQADSIVPKKECLSGWYCCGKGTEMWNEMNAKRTNKPGFLKLDTNLFGDYMETFARHLNKLYKTLPSDYSGRFLDIGGTGSTSSGMQQVTSKFKHFAGPLEYWMLDSDIGAKALPQTIYCDVCNCAEADTCGFDVTFSHTVLEHASRPEQAFDTVARITKKNGLTMHLVPWSYQYHATPDDYYRFSHSALKVLMEDRGFEVLEIGYDICSKQDHKMKNVDEHYDTIWLTYVVARKK